MADRGYRRHRSRSAYESDADRERERERRRRKQAPTSTESSADLLADSRRRNRESREQSSSRSPEKKGYYRSDSSHEKRRTGDEDEAYEREKARQKRREERRAERRRRDEEDTGRGGNVVEVVEYSESGVKNPEVDRYADRERRREERRRRERDEELERDRDRERDRRRREKERGHGDGERKSRKRDDSRRRLVNASDTSGPTPISSGILSAGGLAALDALNEKMGYESGPKRVRQEVDGSELRYREEKLRRKEEHKEEKKRRKEVERREKGTDVYDEYVKKEKRYEVDYVDSPDRRREKGRVVSGQRLERGRGTTYDEKSEVRAHWWNFKNRGGRSNGSASSYTELSIEERTVMKKRRRKTCLIALIVLILLAIAIAVGVIVSKKDSKSAPSDAGGTNADGTPSNSNLKGADPNSVPANLKGGWMDPFSWYDTDDFNVTFTDEMIGDLPVIGLNSSWDDSTRANDQVPPLNQQWSYGKMPIRGINLGGWLVNEPLITPSFYSKFKSSDGVVDEWTLAAKMPAQTIKSTFDQHYSSFVTEGDMQAIQAAGFDHVRIPYGYWAVTTYDGDPYVAQVSWRYLLRAIEWARKYGLRIKLDLHGVPGSQNGWNHSGRQGDIGWLNGTDGALNGKRSLAIHDQLSKFFAQDRYKNIIAIYGLVNEPKMTVLDVPTVLQWTTDAVNTVRANGIKCTIAFGDGFRGLDNWQGQLTNLPGLVLDVHQYVIFNVQQLVLNHHDKTNFACGGWTAQALRSMNTATGFGPTLFAEWSQADTDCAPYLNNVGVGSRWEGTLNMVNTPGGSSNGSVLTPTCPTGNNPRCSCQQANADPGAYSAEYKQWLLGFAEAQMESFEKGWGWFYWTWKTEAATQWSYKDGLAAGILPQKTWNRDFDCGSIPDYAGLGLQEYY